MKRLISLLVVLAMLAAVVPAVLAAEPQAVASGKATAEEDSRCTVAFEATEPGTLTITVGDGKEAWVSDVYSFTTWSASEAVSGTAQQTYTYDVTAIGSYYVRVYGTVDADGIPAAISEVPYTVTFTPSGAAITPTLDKYAEAETVFTEEGTYDVTLSVETAEVTLYRFAPAVTGKYTIEVVGGTVTAELWSTAAYGKMEDAVNGVLSLNATAVGQEWFIALSGEEAAAQVKITKTGEASDEVDYETVMYENKETPVLFDTDKYELDEEKIDSLISFCNEARTTKELMEFLEIQSRQYFLNNILKPLIAEGKILRTIPDKPSSPKQKYIKKT